MRRQHKDCADRMSRGLKCGHATKLPEILAYTVTAIREVLQCMKAFT